MAQTPMILWLWRDGSDYLAFAHEFPCYPGGDPMVAGEPIGRAKFVPSHPSARRLRFAWQPIETAPRNDTELLVWLRSPHHGGHAQICLHPGGSSHWTLADGTDIRAFDYVATHWMPLPLGPENCP